VDLGERQGWGRESVCRRAVESVRATIYVARLPETLQEQFITDIRAIWKARTLL